MLAMQKIDHAREPVSRKAPPGEIRHRPALVWENPAANDCCVREKSKANLRLVSGQTLYGYVIGDPINFIDSDGKNFLAVCGAALTALTIYGYWSLYEWTQNVEKEFEKAHQLADLREKQLDIKNRRSDDNIDQRVREQMQESINDLIDTGLNAPGTILNPPQGKPNPASKMR